MSTAWMRPGWRFGILGVAVGLGLLGSAGCSAGRRPGRLTPSKGSTIGRDLGGAPAGITTPPPSLGVDLVQRPAGLAAPGEDAPADHAHALAFALLDEKRPGNTAARADY